MICGGFVDCNGNFRVTNCVTIFMSPWGSFASFKQNAQNLAMKSVRKDTYKKLIAYGDSEEKKVYKYKEATPEMLEQIRSFKIAENERLRKKRMWVILGLSVIFLMMILIVLTI